MAHTYVGIAGQLVCNYRNDPVQCYCSKFVPDNPWFISAQNAIDNLVTVTSDVAAALATANAALAAANAASGIANNASILASNAQNDATTAISIANSAINANMHTEQDTNALTSNVTETTEVVAALVHNLTEVRFRLGEIETGVVVPPIGLPSTSTDLITWSSTFADLIAPLIPVPPGGVVTSHGSNAPVTVNPLPALINITPGPVPSFVSVGYTGRATLTYAFRGYASSGGQPRLTVNVGGVKIPSSSIIHAGTDEVHTFVACFMLKIGDNLDIGYSTYEPDEIILTADDRLLANTAMYVTLSTLP